MYAAFIKRGIDLVISVCIILVLFLPMLIVAILIKLDSAGPVFYKQTRVGQGLKTFEVLKFRTMTNENREVGQIVGKASGVTKFGYYLRRFKIDELPQVLNVVSGQMSLVGPRPSVPQQLNSMTEDQKKRYNVRPGLTGLAQVNGNIHLSWPERFVFDLQYIKNISFYNDMLILMRTVFIVLKGEENFLNKPLRLKQV